MNKTCDVLQEVRCYERKEKVLECDSECQKIQREKEEVVRSFSVHFHPELCVELVLSKAERFHSETALTWKMMELLS